ncbi:hypothetical protein [Ligilactobacillus ruminis]|uniref:hypothetical protein n=1 Tax=Ligilactobacillus ruminis TaxID=1623 RepID=UPI0022E969AC|nr:hypothetical protein [Ligilactobacillus ruminis]
MQLYQLEKTQEKPTGTKKLHSISEVKFSRSSTPFDKDPIYGQISKNMKTAKRPQPGHLAVFH